MKKTKMKRHSITLSLPNKKTMSFVMSVREGYYVDRKSLMKNFDVDNLGNDLSGLNDVYREIADEIGIENTFVIYRLFHGTQISFPKRLFSKEYTHKAILKEYNGKNVLQLAQKYSYSERSIWRILKANIEK